MSSSAALVYSDTYQNYSFSPSHPMKPERLLLTAELIRAYGILDLPHVWQFEPRMATDEELNLVHDQAYIEKVKELSAHEAPATGSMEWGLGTGDNPVFPQMHEASATIAGASLLAAQKIVSGECTHVFNIAGGLHHAQRSRASGFCIYNDVAVAIAWLRLNQGMRIAYIDIDAHHGDGVQNAFYSDPQVMTISFHESGRSLFPGTGFTSETGSGDARGTAINIPMAPFTSDEELLKTFDDLVPRLLEWFKPEIIVTQDGCDGHWEDPLAHLSMTLKGYAAIWQRMHELAHRFAGGKWLATGGGGYQAYKVVPRAWTLLMAEMSGFQPGDKIPEAWRHLCARFSGGFAPQTLITEEVPAIEPAQAAAALIAINKAVKEIEEGIIGAGA